MTHANTAEIPPSWILGLDVGETCVGALHWVQWMHGQSDGSTSVFAVHTAEHHRLVHLMDKALAELVAAEGASSLIREVAVLEGDDPARSLTAAAAMHNAEALVIGRRKPMEGGAVVKLGKVARRVLRSSTKPAVVVPPDLRVGDVGAGPVLVAVDMKDESAHALAFARRFAAQVGREVLVAHVAPRLDDFGPDYLPADTHRSIDREMLANAEKELDFWGRSRGLHGVRATVVQGSVVPTLVELAARERSPLVVCGSRQLTGAIRLFSGSVGRELAACAETAVAVVPAPLAS